MEFLQPAALYSLLLLPLLLVPYWVKRRPRRLVFSSLLLFGDLAARARAGRWGRLYLPPVFFLQLLLLLLLFLALAEPSLSRRAASVALVLDNSASMQAAEGEKSRFQIARDEAAEVVRSLPAGARVELYLIAPALARVGNTALTAGQALDRIAALKPLDLGEPALDYGAELGRLARERGYERVYFFTDRPADGQSPSVRVVTVGRPRGNLAVASFSVSRSSLTSPELSGRVEIKSFSPREEKFRLDVKGGGRVVASRVYTIAAGKSAAAAFENLPVYPYYEAEIAAADDGLALDNHRFAAAPPAGGLKILAVSPRPEALASLKAIPGVELQVVSPEAYRKGGFGPHALEIFHYAAPAALPDSSALFVLPPGGNPLAGIGAPAARPVISGWREPHPLTRYVNFALFRPAYARPLKLRQFGAPIIDSPDGPLAVALEQKNFRYLALGFDPFPFLGRQNLPMSIFTLNLLDWLNQEAGGASATGRPLDARFGPGETLSTPGGEKVSFPAEAAFARTYTQGIYQASGARGSKYFAVNFDDLKESDLSAPAPVRLRDEPGATSAQTAYGALWPYLLLAALALLLLEWFVHPAAGRGSSRGPSGEAA